MKIGLGGIEGDHFELMDDAGRPRHGDCDGCEVHCMTPENGGGGGSVGTDGGCVRKVGGGAELGGEIHGRLSVSGDR